MAESTHIGVEEEASSSKKSHRRKDHFEPKGTSKERILLIINFILELPTAVLDQLSSVHKPNYALVSMLLSFTVLLISIIDLFYKSKKERVTFMKKGLIPWFYYPYPNPKPFGTFADIVGLVCAIFQCIFASIAYSFLSKHADNPIKVSAWPIIFTFGVLYSRLSGNYLQTRRVRQLNRAEEFTLAELVAATNGFTISNKLIGRRGIFYRGKLVDGREVAIKRRKKFEEESAYESELAFLAKLHHKHVLGLVGYCEEGADWLLVFDYMKNRSLHDQLFDRENIRNDANVIDSWMMRIKIALDAAKGIDYIHNYAVPSIIHSDIKSSSIVVDANWTARISDFELAMMSLESEQDYKSKRAAATIGYVDPEYYALNILTAKSDVYSFGVVLLELLTGKSAIFNDGDNGGKPTSLVDFAVPKILQNELIQVLDDRIGPAESSNEAEAIEVVAYTALHCVNSEGITRPNITNIIINLEEALSLLKENAK